MKEIKKIKEWSLLKGKLIGKYLEGKRSIRLKR
jgi:hypothetical protein